MSDHLTPEQILNDPLLNKGTAFTDEERDRLHLHGLLPCHVSTIQEQLERRYQNFREKPSALSKYSYLSSLQNRNEILFYRLLHEHISEMVPLIYTPTVGDVSLLFSTLYRKNRGIYLSYPLKDKMQAIFSQLSKEIDVIVVTDGQRVLGLGDVGIGGMAISLGKLVLYTLFGGIHPERTLPIMLDVGTDNEALLKDPLYLGWQHPRITGKEYDDFIDLFIQTAKKRFPHVLLQWEDFAKPQAKPLLDRYRDTLCSFNDDIQGTAAVVLAAILAAIKRSKQPLKSQKIVILGAGSAGLGIAHLLFQAMLLEGASEQQARKQFYVIDREGLVHTRLFHLREELRAFAQEYETLATWKLSDPDPEKEQKIPFLDVVRNAHPHILIGVCGQGKMFTETIVKTMAEHCERPIILPLSNPTSHSEAHPADLIQWTKGKAIIATGSPFESVDYEGQSIPIAQCNNVYIFPGIGLGAIACRAKKLSDALFIQAAHILSDHSPFLKNPQAGLFPDLSLLRQISREIAIALVTKAQKEGLCPPTDAQKSVDCIMWFPDY